jgi:rRNA small subunit pseudouridine methyltransferase Nep1
MTILDSPLTKTGHVHIFIHTFENALIQVDPGTRIPRTYPRFAKLMSQLLGI